MKRLITLCAAGAVLFAAAVSCSNQGPKVTALVSGPEGEAVALILEYNAPIDAASVTPETYSVPGREVAAVFVTDRIPRADVFEPKGKPCDKAEKPCGEAKPCDKPCDEAKPCDKPAEEQCDKCKAGEPCEKPAAADTGRCAARPECPEGKPCPDGPKAQPGCPNAECASAVIIVLKGNCAKHGKPCGEAKPCDKPCDEAKPCDKAEKPCDEAKPCDKPCDEAKPCDKPCDEAKPCDKPAEEQCDKCKAGEPCAKGEGEHACKHECEKGKCELTVPEISVRQVAPITGADGKTIAAWKKDAKATAVAMAPKARRGHHGHHGQQPCGHHGAPQPEAAPQQ